MTLQDIGKYIDDLMEERPIPVSDVLSAIQLCARIARPIDLDVITKLANLSGVMDEQISAPAIFSLIAWQIEGLKKLFEIVLTGFNSDIAQAIIFYIAAGQDIKQLKVPCVPDGWHEGCNITITKDVSSMAQVLVRRMVIDQSVDKPLRHRLLNNLALQDSFKTLPGSFSMVDYFFESLIDNRISINSHLLEEFKRILDSRPTREEDLHQFLFDNPILLDPLALEIRSKHELGSEYITDFVVRRANNEYVVVEIEKSTDEIFTRKGVFHSNLTEAVSQVRDFQLWINDNIAYAQSRLPAINRPKGLLVIGRESQLTKGLRRKLDEENYSRRGHISIVTFDDLLNQAKAIYDNMLNKPIMYKGKKRTD
jgi:hypothetical protein